VNSYMDLKTENTYQLHWRVNFLLPNVILYTCRMISILAGLIVSVDRMERGTGSVSALKEIEQTFSMPTSAIVTLDEIVTYLHNRPVNGKVILDDAIKIAIDSYREKYGA
jgi:hypothetical protein